MTEVVFETASLAASIAKAASIAPTTGHAFDKAAGLVLVVDPSQGHVVIKCTNTEVYYMEWIEPLKMEGDAVTWRIPSKVFASVISTLPIGSGKTTKFYNKGNTIYLESGRTKLNRQLIDEEDYPEWGAFDPDDLVTVQDFAAKFDRVSWAASRDNMPPLTGVFFGDGVLAATDRYRISAVPIETPFPEPVVVQAVSLGSLIKPGVPVQLGRSDTQLYLMPDEHTQIRLALFGDKYPPVAKVAKRDQPVEVPIGRDDLLAVLTRAKHVVGSDRALFCTMIIGREEVAFMVNSNDSGLFGDVVEVPGSALHNRVKIMYNQNNLAAALSNSPHELVTLAYDPERMTSPLRVHSGTGEHTYEAWIAPIKKEEAQ